MIKIKFHSSGDQVNLTMSSPFLSSILFLIIDYSNQSTESSQSSSYNPNPSSPSFIKPSTFYHHKP
ncbi:hypothetical protein Hdeb2414_s0010g00352181 [Helianthus debilis subsp. tardiflorus]